MKNIFTMALCLLNIVVIYAQSPDWNWAKGATGTNDDVGTSIGVDSNGNSYVTGYYDSPTILFGTYTLTNAGSRNIFIVKYDANGNVLWAKSAGGIGDDIPGCITVDEDGNSFITGRFYSPAITFDTIVLQNIGCSDVFVVKYDASGNVVWARSSVGSSDAWGRGISLDVMGNIYVTGLFCAPSITFSAITLTCIGNSSVFVTKYDASGNVLWAKSAGGSMDYAYNWAYDICTDEVGNSFVTGFFQSWTITFDTITLTNNNNGTSDLTSDIFIVKYDTYGNVIWAKSAGGTDYDNGNSISIDSDGNAYLAGNFWSSSVTFDTITITTDTTASIFVAKYNPAGNVQWVKATVGSYGCAIHTDSTGNSYLSGDYYGSTITFGTKTLTSIGGSDVFIVMYNTSGDVLWAKNVGGISGDYGRAVTADATGNSYITGFFTSPVINFDTITIQNTMNSGFSQDFFIAKLKDIVTTIPEEYSNTHEVDIYPNPADNKITITTNGNLCGETIINILNFNGEQIMHDKFTSRNQLELDVSALVNGIYFLKIQTKMGVKVKKLVIQ
jgi:hypothetical protein